METPDFDPLVLPAQSRNLVQLYCLLTYCLLTWPFVPDLLVCHHKHWPYVPDLLVCHHKLWPYVPDLLVCHHKLWPFVPDLLVCHHKLCPFVPDLLVCHHKHWPFVPDLLVCHHKHWPFVPDLLVCHHKHWPHVPDLLMCHNWSKYETLPQETSLNTVTKPSDHQSFEKSATTMERQGKKRGMGGRKLGDTDDELSTFIKQGVKMTPKQPTILQRLTALWPWPLGLTLLLDEPGASLSAWCVSSWSSRLSNSEWKKQRPTLVLLKCFPL